MGKYMRKRTGRAPAAEVAQVVVGVRTRSRSAAAAFVSAPAPKRPTKQQAGARAEVEVRRGDGGCYLQLRSRRLFMAVAGEARCPVPAAEGIPPAARSGEASLEPVVVVAGISRCSSTASSVDVVAAAAALERSGGAAEAREDPDGESAISNSECGDRQRREATPSSRLPIDLSDEASSQAAGDPKHQRPMCLPTATAAVDCRARMPAEEEIDDFFAAAEKAEAERFAAKYNFDVARGVPLDAGGRFEWTPVASG